MKSLGLIAVTSVDTEAHCAALMHSKAEIEKKRTVEDMLLISWEEPPKWYTGRTLYLPFKIDIMTYGRFQVRRLANYMTTDYMLNVQADGFVTNGDLWEDEFLNYDYIGAPWAKPQGENGARVGNSGFSIRSRSFMDHSAQCGSELKYAYGWKEYDDQGDDVYWTQHLHAWWAQRCNPLAGIEREHSFPPLDVAARFSVEQKIPEYPNRTPENTFGSHGLGKMMPQ